MMGLIQLHFTTHIQMDLYILMMNITMYLIGITKTTFHILKLT